MAKPKSRVRVIQPRTSLWKIRLHAGSQDHRPAVIIKDPENYGLPTGITGAITFGEMKFRLAKHKSITVFGDPEEDRRLRSTKTIDDDEHTCFIWTSLKHKSLRKLLDEIFEMDTSTSVLIGGMIRYSGQEVHLF